VEQLVQRVEMVVASVAEEGKGKQCLQALAGVGHFDWPGVEEITEEILGQVRICDRPVYIELEVGQILTRPPPIGARPDARSQPLADVAVVHARFGEAML
jgi:hypothetical protein